MSLTKRVLLFSSALMFFSGCDAEPDPGAPRAPLPSEIQGTPQPSGGMPKPRSLPEIRKELEAKKAKEAADKAAPNDAASKPSEPKDSPPATTETPKPAAPPAAPPKDQGRPSPTPE
jgi:hypothetical protein